MQIILYSEKNNKPKIIKVNNEKPINSFLKKSDTNSTIYYGGKIIDTNKYIKDYNIQNNSILFEFFPLKGGNKRITGTFPDFGLLFIYVIISVLMFVLFYNIFDIFINLLEKTDYTQCDQINYIPFKSVFSLDRFKKGGNIGSQISNIFNNFNMDMKNIYKYSTILYVSIIVIVFTIFFHTLGCTTISILPAFLTGVSVFILFVFFIGYFELSKRYNFFRNVAYIVSSIILLVSSITILIVLLWQGFSYLILLFPICTIVALIFYNFVSNFNINKLYKYLIYILLFIFLYVAPFSFSYFNSVSNLCK